MSVDPNTINRSAVCFELQEARNAIDKLIAQVHAGKHDMDAFANAAVTIKNAKGIYNAAESAIRITYRCNGKP